MVYPALIGLGSNLRDRKANLDLAVAALSATPGLTLIAVSSYHETAPVGGPAGQGPFLNAAVLVEAGFHPFDLLTRLQKIESDLGRVRDVRWGERTIDLDVLLYGSARLSTPNLTLPHPRMAVRRFVLAPAVEVAPGLIHAPTGRTLSALLTCLDRRPSLLALAGPTTDLKRQVVAGVCETLPSVKIECVQALSRLLPPRTRETDSHVPSPDAFEADTGLNVLPAPHRPSDEFSDQWIIADFGNAFETAELAALGEAEFAFSPTLGVLVDPARARGPGFYGARFPVIRPDSADPEGMIGEILADCAATRSN